MSPSHPHAVRKEPAKSYKTRKSVTVSVGGGEEKVFHENSALVAACSGRWRKWLTNQHMLNKLWWFFHIISVLYLVVILGLSIDTQMVSTLAWQRSFSPLVSLTSNPLGSRYQSCSPWTDPTRPFAGTLAALPAPPRGVPAPPYRRALLLPEGLPSDARRGGAERCSPHRAHLP